MAEKTSSTDPCAEFTSVQRNALIWFVVVVIGGGVLVSQLARLDNWMYQSKADPLNYEKYTENRSSQTSLASERRDPRASGDFSSARERILQSSK